MAQRMTPGVAELGGIGLGTNADAVEDKRDEEGRRQR
jgi:hypothetical protein